MLKHGILGLLNYGDMSGYEIREVFQESLNYFWTAQTSQIYREIGVLEKNGWIKKQVVEQDGKPNKNLCSITEEGRKELLRWLSEPEVDMDMRSPTLMKTFFMGELPVLNSLNFFKELNKEYRGLLNNLQAADHSIDSYQEMIPDKRNALFWQMTADFGKRYMQMYLDWTESCIHLLESHAESGGHPARYDRSRKKTVFISICGFYTAKSNYESVTAQFDRIYGKGNYTTLFCGEGELFSVPELSNRTDEYLAVVQQAGKEYVSGGINVETNAKLQELLFPRDVFERMADASWGITQTGEKEDISLTFTRQMAALYNPAAYRGTDVILDMDYTDIGKRYRIILGKTGSRVVEQFQEKPATVIHTPFSVWQSIAAGEIEGSAALMKYLYSVEGDFDFMLKWDEYFGQRQNTTIEKDKSASDGKTDMRYVLIPWIVF